MPPSDARFTTIAATSSAANALEVTGGATAEQLALDKGLALSGGTLTDAGIVMPSDVPADTSFALYNNAGTLTWNGIPLATGSSLSGTTGKLAKFTASNAVGDSIVSESGAVVTVTGTLNATSALQLNGTSINTGGTLSNVAYLDQANTFSNASGQTFAGGISLSGGVPSTHGIVIPNAVPGSTTTNLYNNAGALTWSGSVAWGGGSAISSSSNVALLSAANTFTGATQTIDSSGDATLALDSSATGASQIAHYRNGSYKWSVGAGAATNTADMQWYSRTGSALRMTLTEAGLLTVSGFGTHTFSAGGTGFNSFRVRNTTAGTGNGSSLYMGNDSTALLGGLLAFSSTYTTAGSQFASGIELQANGAGGLSLSASDASGDVRIYSRNALAATFGASQAATFTNTLAWGGGSAISSSNNVALLNAANTFSANRQTITANASAEALYILGRSSDDTSQVNFRNNANNANTGYIVAGSTVTLAGAGTGGLSLLASNASGDVRIYSRNALAATFGNGTIDVGSYIYISSAVNPILLSGVQADTGTTLILRADGYVNKLASSLRYKENISTFSVTDDQVKEFIDLQPKFWDYIGMQSGAAGFIAEDLNSLGVRNQYGTSPFVNYDQDGNPESNRDFAIIAMQHMALKQLQARIDALATVVQKQQNDINALSGQVVDDGGSNS